MNWQLHEAIRNLRGDGVIACPTETVYGLSCDPFSAAAVLHLLALKQRGVEQGVVLIAGTFAQLEPLLLPVTGSVHRRVSAPARIPTTWVLPCRPEVPVWLRGLHDTLAVRVTSHPLAQALCREWGGPLVSTSANRHGRQPARSALAVRKAFGNRLDFILHGNTRATGTPSRIRDGISGALLRS